MTEYYGTDLDPHFAKLLGITPIKRFVTSHRSKAAHAERFIRIIKSMLSKYIHTHNKLYWLDVLDHFVKVYNTNIHSITKQRPIDLINEYNLDKIRPREFEERPLKSWPKFSVGDKVQVRITKGLFDKGY